MTLTNVIQTIWAPVRPRSDDIGVAPQSQRGWAGWFGWTGPTVYQHQKRRNDAESSHLDSHSGLHGADGCSQRQLVGREVI